MLPEAGRDESCHILPPPGTGHLPRLGQKLHVMGRPGLARHATSFSDRTDQIPFEGQVPALADLSATWLRSMLHVGKAMRVNQQEIRVLPAAAVLRRERAGHNGDKLTTTWTLWLTCMS